MDNDYDLENITKEYEKSLQRECSEVHRLRKQMHGPTSNGDDSIRNEFETMLNKKQSDIEGILKGIKPPEESPISTIEI